MPALTPLDRTEMIGDAVMAVLASAGGRGLTHRAVDRHLEWPEGSTSRYHRTRDALLTAGVSRLVDVDLSQLERWEQEQERHASTTSQDVARIFGDTYRAWTNGGSMRQIARYELSLEGQRRPAVHAAIVVGRKRLNRGVARLLETRGCTNSATHATALVSYLDGLVHDRLLHSEIAVRPQDVDDLFLRWLTSC